MPATRRKNEIDILTVILCLLVIFIHVSSEPVSQLASGAAHMLITSLWRLASFAMQGFILISAVKFFLKVKDGNFKYLPFLWGRVKTVLIPYIFAVLVFYIYFIYHGYFPFKITDLLKYIFLGNLVSPFYFVVTIMQFYLLMPLWIWITKHVKFYIALPAALVVTLLLWRYLPQVLSWFGVHGFAYNDRVFTTYLIYWTLGCYIGFSYEKFLAFFRRRDVTAICAVAFAALTAVMLIWSDWAMTAGQALGWSFEYLHFAYVVVAILFVYRLTVAAMNLRWPLIGLISRASYYIFLFHCLFIFELDNIFYAHGVTRILERYGVRILVVYIGSLAVCIAYTEAKRYLRKRLIKTK